MDEMSHMIKINIHKRQWEMSSATRAPAEGFKQPNFIKPLMTDNEPTSKRLRMAVCRNRLGLGS